MTSAPEKPHYLGHRKRLKKKFAENPQSLADYEIFEILLGYPLPRIDTKPLAKELIKRFESFNGAIDASLSELRLLRGVGEATEFFWMLLHEIKARYFESPVRRRQILATPEMVALMARHRLAGLVHEELWCALVDSQNRLIEWLCIAKGGLDNIEGMQPRDILAPALKYNASGIILAHNHPGGSPEASNQDKAFTQRIIAAAQLLGVRFIDHLIIAETKFTSMARNATLVTPSRACPRKNSALTERPAFPSDSWSEETNI